MNYGEQVWRLMHDEELLAELIVTGGDFPWLNARIRAMAGFEAVRPLFEEELRALEHIDDDLGSWQAAYDRIRRSVTLHYPEGRPVPEFLLHVDGEDAWWRWSDESFTQAEAETERLPAHCHAAGRAVEMARSWKANLDAPLRASASRAPSVQVLTVGQTSSNRSKTTPISSENVKPIAVH